MKNNNTLAIAFAMLATLGLIGATLIMGTATSAQAALTCETKSGNAPPGQQDPPLKDGCQGSKLVKTPSGNAPPGQNP